MLYDVSVRLSVRLSVTELHWRIIANLGFKFRSTFTAHCGRSAMLATARPSCLARSANLPEGLYILLALISSFFTQSKASSVSTGPIFTIFAPYGRY